MAIIEVHNLSKNFSYYQKDVGFRSSVKNLFYRKKLIKEAVKNISFEIERGEIVGFLGPNGAGKTTTLKMLSGILFPTDGSAKVMGYTPWDRQKAFKMQFSIVMGQKSQLWPDLPANESLYLNKYIYEIEDKQYNRTLDELTELLDVKESLKVQVRRLSLGERMKMELIAALIHRPSVMFLDEPTIGLDVISQRKIRQFIRYYNEQTGTTVIITSHYMKDIEDLCKRSIVINSGKKIFDGELSRVNDLFHQKKIITLQSEQHISRDILNQFGIIRQYNGFSAKIEVDRENVKHYSKFIIDSLPTVDFNIEDVPIEEGIEVLYQKGDDINEVNAKIY